MPTLIYYSVKRWINV